MQKKLNKENHILKYKIKIISVVILFSLLNVFYGDGEIVTVSVQAPFLFQIEYPPMAIHENSILYAYATAESEIRAANADNREIEILKIPMRIESIATLAKSKGYDVQFPKEPRRKRSKKGDTENVLLNRGVFSGIVRFQLGSFGDVINNAIESSSTNFAVAIDSDDEKTDKYTIPTILVSGSDILYISIKDDKDKEIMKQTIRLRSNARFELMDKTFSVKTDIIHLGQKFFLRLTDLDHDSSNEQDVIKIKVSASSGAKKTLELTETIPHSGIFTTVLKPLFIKQSASQEETIDATIKVDFGDKLKFEYIDDKPLQSTSPVKLIVEGKIHNGANGDLTSFSKQFKDPEMAVKTRFLMAEALFEMAKDHRKLKKEDKAKDEISRGKRILEEAMRDFPDTSLVAQGEFLLANLAQELKNFEEAIARYSVVISNWPDSDYAVRAQFKKALSLEKMKRFEQACEEYVRLTYIYSDSDLVADATVRLGNYYYKQEKKYDVAAKIFWNFQKKNPTHSLAVKSLFLAGQSFIKCEDNKIDPKARDYTDSITVLTSLVDQYTQEDTIRPEAMYWLGDVNFKTKEYTLAYQIFKKLTWDYPASKWAKIARGRLTDVAFSKIEEDDM